MYYHNLYCARHLPGERVSVVRGDNGVNDTRLLPLTRDPTSTLSERGRARDRRTPSSPSPGTSSVREPVPGPESVGVRPSRDSRVGYKTSLRPTSPVCKYCFRRFVRMGCLTKHAKTCSLCDICGAVYSDRLARLKHLSHSSCPKCGKTVKQLCRHLRTCDGGTCPKCNRQMTRSLPAHIANCGGSTCPYCGVAFKNMRRHVAFCKVCKSCKVSFSSPTAKIAHDRNCLKCYLCLKTFKTLASKKRHTIFCSTCPKCRVRIKSRHEWIGHRACRAKGIGSGAAKYRGQIGGVRWGQRLPPIAEFTAEDDETHISVPTATVLADYRDLPDQPEVRDIIHRQWPMIRGHYNCTLLSQVYNYRLRESRARIASRLWPIFNSFNHAFHITASFSYVLVNDETGQYTFYYPSRTNNSISEFPFHIENAADFRGFLQAFKNFDPEASAQRLRPGTHFHVVFCPSVSVYVEITPNVPIRTPGLCLFKALWEMLYDKGSGDVEGYKSLARDFVESHPNLFTDFDRSNGVEAIVSHFPGLGFNDLHIFEEFFSTSVNVYCKEDHAGTGRRVALLIRRGDSRYTGNTLNVDLTRDHFEYISDFNLYASHFACQICGFHFHRKYHLQRHLKTCSGKTKFVYSKGYYNPESRALYTELKRHGITDCAKSDFMYPYYGTFDCESVLEKSCDDAGIFVARHRLVSIAINSNVPGFQNEIKCFVTLTGDDDHLTRQFVDHAVEMGSKAAELTQQRLRRVIDSLRIKAETMRKRDSIAETARRPPDPTPLLEVNVSEIATDGSSRKDSNTTKANCYDRLLKRVLEWTSTFPLLGYNSSRYDLSLLARPLFNLLNKVNVDEGRNLRDCRPPTRRAERVARDDPPTDGGAAGTNDTGRVASGPDGAEDGAEVLGAEDGEREGEVFRVEVETEGAEGEEHYIRNIIKRGNQYMGLVTNKLRLLDVTNYISPGFSLSAYLKAFDVAEVKSYFPYEWLDSFDKLRETKLPPYECYYSELKRHNVFEVDVPAGKDPGSVGRQRYRELQQKWVDEKWETIADYLVYYNQEDVRGLLKAIGKQKLLFEQEFDQCMLTSAFSLAGIALNFSFHVAEGRFRHISSSDSDFYKKTREAICGGPSILFHRYAEADVTHLKNSSKLAKRILGFDCASMYLWAAGCELPSGDYVVRDAPSFRKRPRRPASQQSDSALGWLKYQATIRKSYIAHAGNGDEVRVGNRNLPVDGFESATATAFQFMGCYFHACMECYRKKYTTDPSITEHPTFSPETWSDVARRTAENVQYLRDLELNPKIIYQCEWRAQLAELDQRHGGRRPPGGRPVPRAPLPSSPLRGKWGKGKGDPGEGEGNRGIHDPP